jgi:glycogen operon protein
MGATVASWSAREGSASPLGVSWVEAENAYNFALYSKDAERVTLLLYADDPATPVLMYLFDHLRNKSGRIWHCRISKDATRGARY